MIFSILHTILISILFADMIEKRYPEQFQRFILESSFNCIYLFSRFQIGFMKVNNKLKKIIEKNPSLLQMKNNINAFLCKNSCYDVTVQYENKFGIHNYVEDGFTYKKIIFDRTDIDDLFEVSSIKFILLEFSIGETEYKYKIDLKTDTFNYYLVGNKFTKDFFIYYIKNHLHIDSNIIFDTNCKLTIIDHNVKKTELEFTDKNESILLEKNDYIINTANDCNKE
jgi:hypothetical protein